MDVWTDELMKDVPLFGCNILLMDAASSDDDEENYYIHDIGWSDCGIKSVDAFGVAVRFCHDFQVSF